MNFHERKIYIKMSKQVKATSTTNSKAQPQKTPLAKFAEKVVEDMSHGKFTACTKKAGAAGKTTFSLTTREISAIITNLKKDPRYAEPFNAAKKAAEEALSAIRSLIYIYM